jgi:hypothetical protein
MDDDPPEPPPDEAKAQAAHYRARAFEVRKRAVEVSWTGLKASFLQIAGTYDVLARQVEASSAEPLEGEPLAPPIEAAQPDTSHEPKS